MAHYDLEEQEQLDEMKAWWRMYGNLITGVLTALALAALAWQGWNWYQRTQGAEAAAIYAAFDQAMDAGDAHRAKATAGELLDKYGRTSYAPLAALRSAQQAFESGDLKTARLQLTWVVDHGKHEVRDLARLRLAAVMLDDKAYDDALAQLAAGHASAFDARYLDLKGDVLAAQGKKAEARTAYLAAKEKLGTQGGLTLELLKQKIDSLGEA